MLVALGTKKIIKNDIGFTCIILWIFVASSFFHWKKKKQKILGKKNALHNASTRTLIFRQSQPAPNSHGFPSN